MRRLRTCLAAFAAAAVLAAARAVPPDAADDVAALYRAKTAIAPADSVLIEDWPERLQGIYALPRCLKPGFRAAPGFAVLPLGTTPCGLRSNGAGGDEGPAFGVALGDSFTAGEELSAEQVYPSLLTRETGRRFVNLGTAGQSLSGHLARWRQARRAGLKPKVVILQLCFNDLYEDEWVARAESVRALHPPQGWGGRLRSARVAAERRFPFAAYAGHLLLELAAAAVRPPFEPTAEQRLLNAGLLRSLAREVAESGAALVVLAHDDVVAGQARRELPGVPVVRAVLRGRLRLFLDGHWNAAGHRVVARELGLALESAGLLKGGAR